MLNQKNQKSEKKPLNDYAKYSIMGFQMAAVIGLGTWGGTLLDSYFHTKFPVFTIVLALLSVLGAMYWVVKDFLKKK